MRKFLITAFILSFTFTLFLSAQDKQEVVHTINSEIFGKERQIKVFLPNRYNRDSIAKYPVTYILDAQHKIFWDAAKGNIGYLVDNYSVMPMIVVGVVSDNRGSEFNPSNPKLQEHLQKEVFPIVEANYRTDGFRAILGHSWGGAFVGNTLFSDKRDMFNAYIGISPSFGDTDNVIVKRADSLLKLNTKFGKYLYFSYGDVGRREVEFAGYVNSIDSLLKRYPNKTLAFDRRPIERVGHWQIVGPSICDGLISMSRNYFADQKVMQDLSYGTYDIKPFVDSFYLKQWKIFGYTHEPSAAYLNFVANDFRDLEQWDIALSVYKMALEKAETTVKIYVNICDVYDKMGRKDLAESSFRKTKKLLEEQKSEVSKNYYRDVSEWIDEKLNSYKE
ncbi:alpha/beta hydrolase-fold protein [Winogradskyella tangerina]|uniref:alpha/beta hydrolase-fold protein n=1 Tax=Winogradskyella tangerina TaxID=2023240 RepID=UPI000DBE66A3|nr:alpha/beta hydrolase-fold protein [Winogradskyella tangerina]